MNILLLATDAYGGQGGIAYYNRCLAEALAEIPAVKCIHLLPRIVKQAPEPMPAKVNFVARAAGGKRHYLQALAAQLFKPCQLVFCGHINLLPLAAAVSWLRRVPLVLQVHGIDVWQPPKPLHQWCMRQVSAVWTVSRFTQQRMNQWAKGPPSRFTVIPNTIHPERYGMAPKRPDLLQRYGLQGKKVILTLARMDPRERYKGIDEILDALPSLLQAEPSLCYLIAGTGDDQPRLAAKAQELGIAHQVVFAGYVPETEKADLLRLADVFAMPGRGEGFGIVYLEAMACGIPVVGSLLDGSREALQDGAIGQLVNPDDPASLTAGLTEAMHSPKRVPEGLQAFAWKAYAKRINQAVSFF
jgi:glycosyltransferase involved in cell wall biosynthesis